MDTGAFIEIYGLPGAVILGLSYACLYLFRAYEKVQSDRIKDSRESAREIREIAEASNSSMDALTRVLELEGRRDP
ncbi:hypothetical protein T8A63_15185 [Sulfitobacter sp. OXR-159]|uniref:hypothetical protein n=1 Tax=Sulfitobacter sp. OXR-159 TaxID=3100174 RepID=UPI002AC97B4E|nr:hypothetical protein [Sulfitobacter sp. OXR-159]WPZ28957.1 hypothetical protein T8A63_15185 [Sulfitobacter sp. OXR-159]